MIVGPFVIRKYKFEPLTCISLMRVLECVSTPLEDTVYPDEMTIAASTTSKVRARSRSECSKIFSSTWHLVEILEILNLGLNVNPKDQGCDVRIFE